MGLLLLAAVVPAGAAIDVYEFDDPAKEARFKRLIEEFRCPKCLNTNLAGSDAPIAADLRRQVYRMLRDGKSDAEIRGYLRARYGNFILYDPPLEAGTIALWFGPPLLLLIGAVVVFRIVRAHRGGAEETPELSAAERARLQTLLDSGEDPDGSSAR